MDAKHVDAFMLANAKYFRDYQLSSVRDALLNTDESKWLMIQTAQFKDPTLTFIISLLAGQVGIDRFFLGHIGLGIGKLLTCGGLGIWAIVDWFLIMDATRDSNLATLQRLL
ncbi:MAG: TM2 domain-containing protein [Prevotellaceae bacterium]|nr:TM2 domain-containing protein [Prevotellaceae bacterium]